MEIPSPDLAQNRPTQAATLPGLSARSRCLSFHVKQLMGTTIMGGVGAPGRNVLGRDPNRHLHDPGIARPEMRLEEHSPTYAVTVRQARMS